MDSAAGTAAVLAQTHAICSAFAVWMVRPAALDVPVDCDPATQDSMTERVSFSPVTIPRQFGPQTYDEQLNYRSTYPAAWLRTLLLATVIDYAVSTYGREHLPVLVSELEHHEGWDTLVPAVFGVPFEVFEEGWRKHLAVMAE